METTDKYRIYVKVILGTANLCCAYYLMSYVNTPSAGMWIVGIASLLTGLVIALYFLGDQLNKDFLPFFNLYQIHEQVPAVAFGLTIGDIAIISGLLDSPAWWASVVVVLVVLVMSVGWYFLYSRFDDWLRGVGDYYRKDYSLKTCHNCGCSYGGSYCPLCEIQKGR